MSLQWFEIVNYSLSITKRTKGCETKMSPFISMNYEKVSLNINSDNLKEGFIKVTGGNVWFKIVGCESKNIPILLLQGGPGVACDNLECFEEFKNNRPVIFYDQLGCGNSDRPNDISLWTVERFVEEVSQVINSLGINKLHVFGTSWGSMLATAYILKYNQKVKSLILSGVYLSSPIFIKDTRYHVSQLPVKYRDAIEKYEELGDYNDEYNEAMKYYYRQHVRRMDTAPACVVRGRPKFGAQVYNHMWGPSEFTATGTLKDFSLVDRLNEIKVPVILIGGRYDEVRPQTIEYYSSKLSNSELKIIEDASHCCFNEKPDEFINIINNYINKVELNSIR